MTGVLCRIVGACLALSALMGCAFMRAVTFQSDTEYSFKREGSVATLELYGRTNPDDCASGPAKAKSPTDPVIQAIPAVLVASLAQVAVNVAVSEIQGYVERKVKEFTAHYGASLGVPYYYSRAEPPYRAIERWNSLSLNAPFAFASVNPYALSMFNCIRVIRTVKTPDDPEAKAFEWAAALIPNDSGTALRIESKSVKLGLAAARTDKASRRVDLTVEVKIDVTSINEKGAITTTTIGDKILVYPGQTLPVTAERKPVLSSWFPAVPRSPIEISRCESLQTPPACKGVSAVDVFVLVTEVGSGGDAFGQLGKEIDDNKKTLTDAVNKAVSDALTPKPSGGSSK
jgi:hypothetical protein